MSITAIIPHYFVERTPNLLAIVPALRHTASPLNEILIWNNDWPNSTLSLLVDKADVIQCHRNAGPQARFLAARLARSEYIYFQDNDVLLGPKELENMYAAANENKALISLEGRVVTDGRYRTSVRYRNPAEPTLVDISLGRAEMIHSSILQEALKYFPWSTDPMMDDLWFSHCLDRIGASKIIIPLIEDGGFRQLPEYGVGSRFDESHYRVRDELCRRFWGPQQQPHPTMGEGPCG